MYTLIPIKSYKKLWFISFINSVRFKYDKYLLSPWGTYYAYNAEEGTCEKWEHKKVKNYIREHLGDFSNVCSYGKRAINPIVQTDMLPINIQLQDELIFIMSSSLIVIWYNNSAVIYEATEGLTLHFVEILSLSPLRIKLWGDIMLEPLQISYSDCITKVCLSI